MKDIKQFFLLTVIACGFFITILIHYTDLHWLLAYCIVINCMTLIVYAYDKAIADTTLRRIPEMILHMLTLFGGSPAAILSQNFFRHKTQKSTFQLIQWLIIAVQMGIVVYIIYSRF